MSIDHHYDSVDCDRKMVKRHLRYMQRKRSPNIDIRGLFRCDAGGKFDKRSSKGALDPNFFGQAISMRW